MKETLKTISKNTKISYITVFCGIWLMLLIVLPWKGDFFLNDDQVYEWNVRNFQTRGLNFHAYTGPSTIFQTILGVGIYSVSTDPSLLRLMTSFFYLLGVIFLFKTLILEQVKPKTAFFLSLVLMFNPLYLYLGFTFMSDTYFLTTSIISIYYFLLSNKENDIRNRFLSMLFLCLSFLSRQQAIFLIPTYILVDFIFLRKRELGKYSFYVIPLLTVFVFQFLIPTTTAYNQGSLIKTAEMLLDKHTYILSIERMVKSLYYIGFFSIPITLPFLIKKTKDKNLFNLKYLLPFVLSSSILLFFSLIFWILNKQVMFYIPNIITYAGFLPSSILIGIKQTIFVNSPLMVQTLITLVSILSFSSLILFKIENNEGLPKLIGTFKKHPSLPVYLLSVIFTLIMLLLFRSYYDRYLLILLPPMLVSFGIFSKSFENYLPLGYLFLFLFVIMSVCFEQDYLSLNRTAWEVPEQIGIDKMSYKGSIEFNAYQRLDIIKDAKNTQDFEEINWLPKDKDYKYYISYIPLPNYCLVSEINYKSYISPKFNGSLVVLEKGCYETDTLNSK